MVRPVPARPLVDTGCVRARCARRRRPRRRGPGRARRRRRLAGISSPARGASGEAAGRVLGSIVRPEPEAEAGVGVQPTHRSRAPRRVPHPAGDAPLHLDGPGEGSIGARRARRRRTIDRLRRRAPTATTPALPALAVAAGDLLLRLQPTRTVVDSVRARVTLGSLSFDPFVEMIRPIMAAPASTDRCTRRSTGTTASGSCRDSACCRSPSWSPCCRQTTSSPRPSSWV